MIADTSHYKHLNELQRRALGLVGHDTLLQSHSLRSKVTALCYPYKRHYLAGPQQLMDMPPPAATPHLNPRKQHQQHAWHKFELDNTLNRSEPDYLQRGDFPCGILGTWNITIIKYVLVYHTAMTRYPVSSVSALWMTMQLLPKTRYLTLQTRNFPVFLINNFAYKSPPKLLFAPHNTFFKQ